MIVCAKNCNFSLTTSTSNLVPCRSPCSIHCSLASQMTMDLQRQMHDAVAAAMMAAQAAAQTVASLAGQMAPRVLTELVVVVTPPVHTRKLLKCNAKVDKGQSGLTALRTGHDRHEVPCRHAPFQIGRRDGRAGFNAFSVQGDNPSGHYRKVCSTKITP